MYSSIPHTLTKVGINMLGRNICSDFQCSSLQYDGLVHLPVRSPLKAHRVPWLSLRPPGT